MAYVITCCSTADLSAEHFRKINVPHVCFHYALDGEEFLDTPGTDMAAFYGRMQAGAETRTSQVSIGEYLDFFTPFLEQGLDLLHVCFSGGLSGTVNSARGAADIARERYPERTIYIVDSLAASSGYGLMVDTMAAMRDSGKPLEEVWDWAMENRLTLHHWFFSTDLSFYVRGGRVSRAAGLLGGMLNICPLLHMNDAGRLTPVSKIRGKKKVISEMVEMMAAHAIDGENYSGKCYISHSECYEDARRVADLIDARFPRLNGPVEINSVGTAIGSHTGPGTVALFFFGDTRKG